MLFAQTCDSTFEVGLSKTMSVPSKYIPFFLNCARGSAFFFGIIFGPLFPRPNQIIHANRIEGKYQRVFLLRRPVQIGVD